EAAEQVRGLTNRRKPGILRDHVLEGLLGPLAGLLRGAGSLRLNGQGPGLCESDGALGLVARLPEGPAPPDEAHHAHGRASADRRLQGVPGADPFEQRHRGSSTSRGVVSATRAGSARSSQISPLTEEPSAAEKLPALRVPVSTPLGRMSRWV